MSSFRERPLAHPERERPVRPRFPGRAISNLDGALGARTTTRLPGPFPSLGSEGESDGCLGYVDWMMLPSQERS